MHNVHRYYKQSIHIRRDLNANIIEDYGRQISNLSSHYTKRYHKYNVSLSLPVFIIKWPCTLENSRFTYHRRKKNRVV